MTEQKERQLALPHLKEIREAKGFTQKDLSDKADLCGAIVISRLETGSTERPSFATVWAISEALGVPVEDLVNGQSSEQ